MHRPLALMALITVLSAHTASAQDTGTGAVTQGSSSSSMQEDLAKAWRAKRIDGFATALKKFKTKDTQFQEQVASYRKSRITRRAECRADLRKVNKQAKLATLLRCYKGDMTAERELLQKYIAFLQEVPGLTSATRVMSVDRTETLLDSVETVIDGIDSGVYETEADVQETKKNLLQKYRTKAWSSWTTARADKELTWVALMITDIDELAKASTSNTFTEARLCFVTQETALQNLLEMTTPQALALATIHTDLEKCGKMLEGALAVEVLKESGSGASVGEM